MIVRNFKDSDIKNAKELSHFVWGDFYKKESFTVQKLIYDFTFDYYDLNRALSYSVLGDNASYKGFLLAFNKKDKNKSSAKISNIVKTLDDKEIENLLSELYVFLEFCGNKTKQYMKDDDVMLGLFVSVQKGCGRILLEKLLKDCKKNNIGNIYLWSDTTCNYDYYLRNDFELLDKINTILNKKEITIFIYRKKCINF